MVELKSLAESDWRTHVAAARAWLARWLAGAAAASACIYCAVHWADLFAMHWPQRHPWLFEEPAALARDIDVLNALFGLTLYVLARLLFARVAAAILSIGVLAAIAAISTRKMLELDLPLLPWDLWFAGNVADLATFLDWSLVTVLLFAAAAASVLVTIAWRLPTAVLRIRRGLLGSVVAASGLTGVCAWGVVLPATPRGLSGQVHNIAWDQGANFTNFGPYYAFVINLPFIGLRSPNKDELNAADTLDTRQSMLMDSTGEKPNIVLILSESFTRLPIQLFGRSFNCLGAADGSRLLTPAWGGFTANVEFELLTGYPHALFPPGSVPYQMYLTRPVASSLPRTLQSLGWRTEAAHTYHRNFFSRPQAYASLGIDTFAGLEDIPRASRHGWFVDDRVLFRHILQRLEAASAEPLFMHAVSMMAHLPYAVEGRFPIEQGLDARLPAELDADRLSLTQYASMIYDHERALCDFLATLPSLTRRTLVLFYGDHYPTFGTFEVYERINRVLHGPDVALDIGRDFSKPPVAMFDSRRGFIQLPEEVAAYNAGALVLREAGIEPGGHWALPHKRDQIALVRRLRVAAHQASHTLADSAQRAESPELRTLRAHAWQHLFEVHTTASGVTTRQ
jgi:phosphoglycerol transferase MdoB-like AlkP superfamily enzyme